MSIKTPFESYYKLRRTDAQLLANFVRKEKGMELPQGWYVFYRLTPAQIAKRYPALSLEEIMREARIQKEVEPQ